MTNIPHLSIPARFRIHRAGRWTLVLALLVASPIPSSLGHAHTAGASTAAGPRVLTGSIDGAAYKIEVPAPWNGTLVLYSHAMVFPGQPNPATDVGDPRTGRWLLAHGYALAGSSFSRIGWAVAQAFHDQIALLDLFARRVGPPQRTIAWGHSIGGLITAGLVQKFPRRFSGALPMCGLLSGAVAFNNQSLDSTFVFKTLVAPTSRLQLVHISNQDANSKLTARLLAAAQRTPQGRARLALAAAVADIPGWFDPASREPSSQDVAAQEHNQFLYENLDFGGDAELEQRAGGNPSWNTGVNYQDLLAHSTDQAEVQVLYRQAGLSLAQDLRTLQRAPRIAADPRAVRYVRQNIIFNGRIQVPILTLHTTGDGIVPVQNEQAYASVVAAAGHGGLLRQIFVHRAFHCSFTPAETIAAFQVLIQRMDTGQWADTANARALNRAAAALGAHLNVDALLFNPKGTIPTAPAFVPFQPSPFLRPFDARSGQ